LFEFSLRNITFLIYEVQILYKVVLFYGSITCRMLHPKLIYGAFAFICMYIEVNNFVIIRVLLTESDAWWLRDMRLWFKSLAAVVTTNCCRFIWYHFMMTELFPNICVECNRIFCCCYRHCFSISVRFLSFLICYAVGFLEWRICLSEGLCTQGRTNTHRPPCLEWDSNPRSQCLSGLGPRGHWSVVAGLFWRKYTGR
jgi:hypothetical protein